MRELTKSITSYTWAMSVFCTQQMFNLFGLSGSGAWDRSTKSFKNVTDATTNEMGETMRAVFRGGDTLQRGVVDLFLAPLSVVNWGNGARENGADNGRSDRNNGAGGTGNWRDTASRTAQTGADARAQADAAARTARQQPPSSQPRGPSAPPSSDPSLGWGPMPR